MLFTVKKGSLMLGISSCFVSLTLMIPIIRTEGIIGEVKFSLLQLCGHPSVVYHRGINVDRILL